MNKKQIGFIIFASIFCFAAPVLAGSTLVSLGGAIYKDLNLSINQNQACMSCHHPSSGFADPVNRTAPALFPVSEGSIDGLFGGRNAPSAAYAGFNPIFHYDEETGLFVGGIFWDGRASGRDDVTATGGLGAGPTGDPLADQAKGPFGNPVEMALTPDTEAWVVSIIQSSDYADQFEKVFGPNAFADTGVAYNNASLALAAFERSKTVTKFNSKFDKFIQEQGGDVSTFGVAVQGDGFRKYIGPPQGFKSKYFSYAEADGLAIFNADSYTQLQYDPAGPANGGMCYLCHLTENHTVTAADPYLPANGPLPGTYHPLLTDFTFDNLGIPANPRIAELAGVQGIDYGLGGQTDLIAAACDTCDPFAEEGKFKVPTLRNLSRTAPYGHNGFFATIYEIVHFYNTRDAAGAAWPAPEVSQNMNSAELGNLGLTPQQEQNLVRFLQTLNE